MSETELKLWHETMPEDDIYRMAEHSPDDAVINLLEDIKCLKDDLRQARADQPRPDCDKPVAWTNEAQLSHVAEDGEGYIFDQREESPIPLYRQPRTERQRKFRHNNGVICSGTIRVAVADFDTDPAPEVKQQILDELCYGVPGQPRPAVPDDCVAFPKSTLRDIISVIGEHFPDCIDNDGQPYQSQHLADLLKAAQQPEGGDDQ